MTGTQWLYLALAIVMLVAWWASLSRAEKAAEQYNLAQTLLSTAKGVLFAFAYFACIAHL